MIPCGRVLFISGLAVLQVLLPSDAGSALKVACSGDQSILITEKYDLHT